MNAAMEESSYALRPFRPASDAVYTIDAAANIARLPRYFVLVCCKHGLISPRIDPDYGGYYFDEISLRTLQRIAYLHADCSVNLTGIRIILGLMDEVERLKIAQAQSM